ncbi:MAG TPA: hypothetical protein VJ032_09130 [Thermoanaerobaculia bacterium]|nr:hypothetical protein [Thermoanaerobaculia bacterium]
MSVRVAGVNVQELLATPFEQLRPHADTFGIPVSLIDAVCDLGIGYVAPGRRIDSLSGGEVQRLRLAMRLGVETAGATLFVMDEPAVGLHARDVRRLVSALDRVLDGGRNTIVIIEHDLRLIRSADWVIDFGPNSGPAGGKIVFAGAPAGLARGKTQTGLALDGKLPAAKDQAARKNKTSPHVGIKEQVDRTNALLRTLITGDATASVGEDSTTEPIVLLSDRFWSDRDSWEVGGLDSEIPKLLLDLQRVPAAELFTVLLDAWKHDANSWLAIHPFLSDMQTWGAAVPESSLRATKTFLTKERLQLVNATGKPARAEFDVREIRATGARFIPPEDADDARLSVLRDAFAVGAHYVELRDAKGRLLATASDRLVDLKRAIVGPMSAIPSHFQRRDPLGRCAVCEGSRRVTALNESLIVSDAKRPPDHDAFLTKQANAIMKGVRHNELKPFLRRLSKEGLWDRTRPFRRLDSAAKDQILFGFWSRPGHGSFLKPSGDPAQVSAWLRWDGLYRRVIGELDRSGDTVWAERVRATSRQLSCPECRGTGLQPFAALLKVNDISFYEWVGLDPADMYGALADVETKTARQRKTKQRLLQCLEPLRKASGRGEAAVAKLAVAAFTTMDSAEADAVAEI